MVKEPEPTLIQIVLVEPKIAANAGNIGRTCVALGASLTLVRPLGFHLDDRRLRRAGLDYWTHLDLVVADSVAEALANRPVDRIWCFENAPGARLYTSVQFRIGDTLIFGAEDSGLPKSLVASACEYKHLLEIPIRPQARSLNLANAVAVAAYEAFRQIEDAIGRNTEGPAETAGP